MNEPSNLHLQFNSRGWILSRPQWDVRWLFLRCLCLCWCRPTWARYRRKKKQKRKKNPIRKQSVSPCVQTWICSRSSISGWAGGCWARSGDSLGSPWWHCPDTWRATRGSPRRDGSLSWRPWRGSPPAGRASDLWETNNGMFYDIWQHSRMRWMHMRVNPHDPTGISGRPVVASGHTT